MSLSSRAERTEPVMAEGVAAQVRALTAAAFSAEAAVYDEGFGRNPIGQRFRAVFQARLASLFAPGTRVLDLGCGTGEDALHLVARGVHVHAIDVAPGMVARTRAKAAALGIEAQRLTVEVRPAEDVAACGPGFDGAYSDFGALNCTDLRAVGQGLAQALRPGAPVLLSLMGPHPLPAWLAARLRARPAARGVRVPRVAGLDVATDYLPAAEVRRRLGAEFAWRAPQALGVLMPDPNYGAWGGRWPRVLAALDRVEGWVRGWPGLRALGDHVLHEGRRR